MLESLFNLVKGLGQEHVVDNPAIPDEHNDAVIAEATHSVASGLQDGLASGQGQEVMDLLHGQTGGDVMNSPVAKTMQVSFLENITSKLGINSTAASGLASSFIPMILNRLVHQTNDPNNGSFDVSSIISSLTGGSSQGTGGGISGLVSQFMGGAQRQQAQQGSGGLMDVIKGFMHA